MNVQKAKIYPRGKTPTTAWGKTSMCMGVLPHSFSPCILPHTCDYCGDGYLQINRYEWHGNADNLVTNIKHIFKRFRWPTKCGNASLCFSAMTWDTEWSQEGCFVRLTVIPTGMIDYMPDKMWGETTHAFTNFNGCTFEVWECGSVISSHTL